MVCNSLLEMPTSTQALTLKFGSLNCALFFYQIYYEAWLKESVQLTGQNNFLKKDT